MASQLAPLYLHLVKRLLPLESHMCFPSLVSQLRWWSSANLSLTWRGSDRSKNKCRVMQLLKNREEALAAKSAAPGSSSSKGGREARRGRARSDESESLAKVQALGQAFQKIQAATGIHVRNFDICRLIDCRTYICRCCAQHAVAVVAVWGMATRPVCVRGLNVQLACSRPWRNVPWVVRSLLHVRSTWCCPRAVSGNISTPTPDSAWRSLESTYRSGFSGSLNKRCPCLSQSIQSTQFWVFTR